MDVVVPVDTHGPTRIDCANQQEITKRDAWPLIDLLWYRLGQSAETARLSRGLSVEGTRCGKRRIEKTQLMIHVSGEDRRNNPE